MKCPFCAHLEDKVVDYVFEQAQVKEKAVSKDALQKAVEKLEEA